MAVILHDAGFFAGDKTVPRFEVQPGSAMRVRIPNAARDEIGRAYRKVYGREPNESTVAQAYLRLKGTPGVP
jgi:hypothetical protein